MREFNIAGKIIPEQHYYVDITPQLKKAMGLVDKGAYFVISKPRQFGKTTLLNFLAKHLSSTGIYLPILISFEGFAEKSELPEDKFYTIFWKNVLLYLESINAKCQWLPVATGEESNDQFQENVRSFCKAVHEKKTVLLVDEVDSIPQGAVISFLRALRKMYLERDRLPTFHSMGFAGVQDIKNLKAQYRGESHALGSASPFNIAINYEIPAFSIENIQQYYFQHTTETGQRFDEQTIVRVYQITRGHPWLVSALAKLLTEDIVPDRCIAISPSHLEIGVQRLLRLSNTNFDSLVKHAREPDLQPVILDILQGKEYPYTLYDPVINRLALYGLIDRDENNRCAIANQIYAQVLLASFHGVMAAQMLGGDAKADLEDAGGRLNLRHVLEKFQAFMKSKGAQIVRSHEFKEAVGQLLLLSYLDFVVNGKGWTFKEVQSSQGKIDVVCCYKNQKEIIELKLWYGKSRYEDGLEQLAQYLDSEGLNQGYLVVFDRREAAPGNYLFREHEVAGKKILAWVV